MSGFNYSKWDNIELSDDESDLHPNIDKDSWFRMKHRTRLEREAQEDGEMKTIKELNRDDTARLGVLSKQIERLKKSDGEEVDDLEALEGEAAEISLQLAARNKRIKEIEVKRSWNMENICKTKEEKTVISTYENKSLKAEDFVPTGETEKRFANQNEETMSKTTSNTSTSTPASTSTGKGAPTPTSTSTSTTSTKFNPMVSTNNKPGPKPENINLLSYNDYVLKYEEILEKYSVLDTMEISKDYLFKNCDILLHEHSQNYLLLSCLEDEMNGKKDRCRIVCRQSQILSHLQELGVSMNRDPRDVILPFFARMDEKQHFESFKSAVDAFHSRIKNRAVEKRKEMDLEREKEEEESVQLGPGGLNPIKVLRELPQALRDAFESQDIERLQDVLATMKPAEAKSCMKKCVDAGLWVASDPSVLEGDNDEYEGDGDIGNNTSGKGAVPEREEEID